MSTKTVIQNSRKGEAGRFDGSLATILLDDLWNDYLIDGHQVVVLVGIDDQGSFKAIIDEGRTFRQITGTYTATGDDKVLTKTIRWGDRYDDLKLAFLGGIYNMNGHGKTVAEPVKKTAKKTPTKAPATDAEIVESLAKSEVQADAVSAATASAQLTRSLKPVKVRIPKAKPAIVHASATEANLAVRNELTKLGVVAKIAVSG